MSRFSIGPVGAAITIATLLLSQCGAVCEAATEIIYDFDDDGDINGADLGIWGSQFGSSASLAQSVPEPSSLMLSLFMASGVAAWRQRR